MKQRLLLMAALAIFLLTGCYLNDEVNTNQVGVKLDKNKIIEVVGPGVYTEAMCFYCDLKEIDVDTQTFSVEDPEVLTSDNQAIGLKVTIQARRKRDDQSVKNILTNWSALTDNTNLVNTISATAREGMKNGVRGFTLATLLDDRNQLAEAISKQLEEDAAKYSVDIVNVTIENVAPSQEYMAILSETANLKAQTEQEKRRQDLINQKAANSILEQQKRVDVANAQVLAERAETLVQVEIASRAGKVVAAQNQVYVDNPQAFILEKLRLLKDVFSNKTVMFIPEGMNMNTFFNLDNLLNPANAVQQTQP